MKGHKIDVIDRIKFWFCFFIKAQTRAVNCFKLRFPQILTGQANPLHYHCSCFISIVISSHLFDSDFNYSSVCSAFLKILFSFVFPYKIRGQTFDRKCFHTTDKLCRNGKFPVTTSGFVFL